MKILAFADLHEKITALKEIEKKAKNADIIICAGDLTIFETNIAPLMARLGRIKKTIYMIPGNHETPEVLKKYCSRYKNIKFFHKKIIKCKQYYLMGWGGGGFDHKSKEFEEFTRKTDTKNKKIILVTHAPPYKTTLDQIEQEHYGNKSVKSYLEKNRNIILYICGHFHENAGKKDKINKTLIINPGPAGQIITI